MLAGVLLPKRRLHLVETTRVVNGSVSI